MFRMRCYLPAVMAVMMVALFAAPFHSQSVPPPPTQPPKPAEEQTVRISSSEVLLDLIVRDKKGQVISDLRPEEIEVYEDGSKQPVNAVRLREFTKSVTAEELAQNVAAPRKPGFDPSRPLMLVSLVFENLDLNGRDLVRRSAMSFIDNALYDNVLIGVFASGPRLFLIQQYTNDRVKLSQAIDKITARAEKPWEKFAQVSDAALNKLGVQILTGDPAGFSATGRGPGIARIISGDGDPLSPAAGPGAQAPVIDPEIYFARMMLNIYRSLEITQREEQARMAIYPLLQMVREQKKLPGRKTIVYFSNGFAVPTILVPVYHQALSEANRANVSIYTVDARGLSVEADGAAGLREQQLAVQQSEEMRTSGQAIRSDAFTAFDTAQDGTRLNKQQTLREVAESTGGFIVTSTNDLRNPLKRMAAELSSYYEVYYEPTSQKQDGKFRKITVKILRPGLKVQTRNGYFATPPVEEKALAEATRPGAVSSEKLLGDTLNAESLPQAFAHRAVPLRFAAEKEATQYVLAVEVPMSSLSPRINPEMKSWDTQLAVMVRARNAKGEILQQIARDYPLRGVYEKDEDLKRTSVELTYPLTLPPGNHFLETAAFDRNGNRLSAYRQIINVRAPADGIRISTFTFIKRLEQIRDKQMEANPLLLREGKIIPGLGDPLSVASQDFISFFLEVYPDKNADEPPQLELTLLQNGNVISQGAPALPKADDKGRIGYIASLPVKGIQSGSYELRATVTQGNIQAQERNVFTLTRTDPEAALAEAKQREAEKIAAAQNAQHAIEEKTGTPPKEDPAELRPETVTSAAPLAINTTDLIAEVLKNGKVMSRRLLGYTYHLKRTRRTLLGNGWTEAEEEQDCEAYPIPVRGSHALVQLTSNGKPLSGGAIEKQRQEAGISLQQAEAVKEAARTAPPADAAGNPDNANAAEPQIYMSAGASGSYKGKWRAIALDPVTILQTSELTSAHYEKIGERQVIAVDFQLRADAQLPEKQAFLHHFRGKAWIDVEDKVLVRLEAVPDAEKIKSMDVSVTKAVRTRLLYEQQRLAGGIWVPRLIRLNAGGNGKLFNGLNWDVIFEFGKFQKFNTAGEQTKTNVPPK